ncbi:MAG: hypothetical protein Unbinned2072contig1001_27 [Prokaryotic dsDNA virus sp.]|nr:MAG: hypothetical protein Unbinned2072contig1001_27 [Prokaryotic dsDNA virus sp.]|tara:strand:+ start:3497 stop:3775 length:279 start_codon:yes stop_codon:yes gene_type:complete
MAQEINENTKLTLDLKTIAIVVSFTITLASMWFTLKSDIALAKELPAPEVSKVEYDLKDKLVREQIFQTSEDVNEIKETLKRLEERVYELNK